MKKVVLAFSGGIGTTACLDLLRRRYQAEVITYTASLGQRASTEAISDHALDLGASRTLLGDLRERFVKSFVWPVLRAGAVYHSGYALSSAIARPLVVAEVVRMAHEVGADTIAHGCAAKSNDQVRFEISAAALAPELTVLSPLRDHGLLRADEIRGYLKKNAIPARQSGESFSITENLWGTTFQWGRAPDTWEDVPEAHYRLTCNPHDAPDTPRVLTVSFERGVPVAIDDEALDPVPLLEQLGRAAGEHGVGRVETFEDRLIGIKTRDVYEQPAATVLHLAREALESLVLSRDMLRLKPGVSARYANLVYDGFWYSELRQAYDSFFDTVVEHVSGDVRLEFYRGRARVRGVRSPHSLYSRGRASTSNKDEDVFDHSNVRGMLGTLSTSIKNQAQRQHPLWGQELL